MRIYTTLLLLLLAATVYGQADTLRGISTPDKIDSLVLVANAHLRKGDYYKAEKGYKQVLEVCNDEKKRAWILNNLASTYMYRHKYDTAVVLFQQVIAIRMANNNKPDLSNTYSNLGILYKRIYQYPKALACYKQALHYNNDDAKHTVISNNIAQIYYTRRVPQCPWLPAPQHPKPTDTEQYCQMFYLYQPCRFGNPLF